MKKVWIFIMLILTIISIVTIFIYPLYQINEKNVEEDVTMVMKEYDKITIENTLTKDIYLTKIAEIMVIYINYNHEQYQSLKTSTSLNFLNRLIKLFDTWLNPFIIIILVMTFITLFFLLSIILIKCIIGLIINKVPKLLFITIVCLFLVICLININILIPDSFYQNATNLGTISTLKVVKELKKHEGLDILLWTLSSSIVSIGFMNIFNEKIQKERIILKER